MDKSKVEAVVKREPPRLADMLHVGHWRINVLYDTSGMEDRDHIAECGRNLAYERATIYLVPDRHDDEAEVIDSIRHELLHVVLAPFDMLWALLTEPLEGVQLQQAKTAWRFSCEQTIVTLERIVRDLCARSAKAEGPSGAIPGAMKAKSAARKPKKNAKGT